MSVSIGLTIWNAIVLEETAATVDGEGVGHSYAKAQNLSRQLAEEYDDAMALSSAHAFENGVETRL